MRNIILNAHTWIHDNKIPVQWRALFLELACRMNERALPFPADRQIVLTSALWREPVMKALGWDVNSRSRFQKGLKALCECGAIRRVSQGVYEINPQYAQRME